MSPEQASGDSTDKRADIWSFGVVLFEMVTGRKTFDGKTVAHILADVLRAEPEWNSLPPNLHPRLRLLLERCLEKEAKDRCHDIADVRVDIQKVLADPGGVIAQPGNGVRPRRVMPGMFALFSAFVLGGVLVGLSLWSFTTTPPVPTVKRFSITAEGEPQRTMALSADGRYLVYQTKGQLYLRAMHQMESAPIPGTEGGQDPMLSPDGQELAFVTDTQVKKVSLTDGSLDILTDFDLGNLGQWGPQGQIIFGTEGPGGLFKVSENGGLPEPLVELDGYLDVDWPVVLPGGEWVLFSADDGTRPDGQRAFHVVAESLVSGDRRVLLDDGRFARYAPTGHLIFFRDGRLFAVGFDADQVQTTGTPVQMIENVAGGTGFSNVPFALADDGSLVYVPGTGPSDSRILALAHRNGGVEPLDVPPAQYFSPRISPDGTRLAVQTLEDDGRNQVWVYDLAGDTQIRRLTQDGSNERPVWTPDSKRVTFSSDREGTLGIYSQPADFSGAAEKLVTVEGASLLWPESYSPDGTLSFTQQQGSYRSIWTLSPDAGATPELFYDAPGSAQAGTAFSPDGDWLAYYSQESGPSQIFVKSLSQAGLPRIQVTQENSVLPMWSRDGTEMFYRRSFASPAFAGNTGATLISVEIATDRGFSFRNERVLPISGFLVFSTYRDYDVMPDGERFVVIVPADATETTEAARPQINVILNFFEELKDRVPVP